MSNDRDGVFRRGKTWVGQVDLGRWPAQRCQSCGKGARWWVDRTPLEACPKCAGLLVDTVERRREWQGGFPTKTAAKTWRDEQTTAQRRGEKVVRTDETLGEYLTDWLAALDGSVRETTLASYTFLVRRYVGADTIAHKPLQRLTDTDLEAFYARIRKGGGMNGKPLSPRTVQMVHVALHKALGKATKSGRVLRNVATLVDRPKAATAKLRTWSADELRKFLGSIENDRLSAAYFLAATTGLRRGEVLGLSWRNLDLAAGVLAVDRTLVMVGYRPTFSEPKTKAGRRSVALDPRTVRTLTEHRKRQLEEHLALGYRNEADLVFVDTDGSPINPDRFSDRFDYFERQAGLPHVSLHGLRHTWATLALRAGEHPKVVQERLGHSSIRVTMDTYSSVMPEMQREAADRVAALVFG